MMGRMMMMNWLNSFVGREHLHKSQREMLRTKNFSLQTEKLEIQPWYRVLLIKGEKKW